MHEESGDLGRHHRYDTSTRWFRLAKSFSEEVQSVMQKVDNQVKKLTATQKGALTHLVGEDGFPPDYDTVRHIITPRDQTSN